MFYCYASILIIRQCKIEGFLFWCL